jgi:hypothetical protein
MKQRMSLRGCGVGWRPGYASYPTPLPLGDGPMKRGEFIAQDHAHYPTGCGLLAKTVLKQRIEAAVSEDKFVDATGR